MQPRSIGTILTAIGILMITYTGFGFVTTEKMTTLGITRFIKEKNHSFKWSPVLGTALLTFGLVLIVRDKKVPG